MSGHLSKHAAGQTDEASSPSLFGSLPNTATAAEQVEKPSSGGVFGGGQATSTAAQRDGKTSGGGLFGGGPATSAAAQREVKPYGGGLLGQASTVAPSQEAVKSSVGTLFGRAPAITTTDQQGATMSREGGQFGGQFGVVPISTQTAGSFGGFGAAANTATPAAQQGTAMPPKGEFLGEAGKTRTPAQQKENPLSTGLVGGGHTSATSSQRYRSVRRATNNNGASPAGTDRAL